MPPNQRNPTPLILLWTSIAQLGGYQARKSDGPPGWLTIWRGWQTLNHILTGYHLAGP